MKSFTQIILFLVVCCYVGISSAQVIEKDIDSIITSKVNSDSFGVILLVKEKGKVLYDKAFGKSNIELKQDMKTDNIFDIGSITKEFTAVSILQLKDKGKLKLDDDIRMYIPDYPTQGYKITIENLLTHTSGIKSHTDSSWAENEAGLFFENTIDVIDYYKNDSLEFAPGDKYSYANVGYLILGHIIEKVSGLTYADYLNKYIFKPLGMTNTFFPTDGEEIKNKAKGYEVEDGSIVPARYYSLSQGRGDGGIHSTTSDISKWYDGLLSNKVISRESLEKAWSPYKLNNGSFSNYGYGFFSDKKFDKLTIFHTGFIFGSSTSDLFFPEDDLLIFLFSNISDNKTINTNEIVFDIASSIYKNKTPKLTTEQLDKFVGIYTMKKGFSAKVFREELQLMISVDGQPANKLYPESETLFIVKDFPAKVEFLPDINTINIILSMGPNRFEGSKITE